MPVGSASYVWGRFNTFGIALPLLQTVCCSIRLQEILVKESELCAAKSVWTHDSLATTSAKCTSCRTEQSNMLMCVHVVTTNAASSCMHKDRKRRSPSVESCCKSLLFASFNDLHHCRCSSAWPSSSPSPGEQMSEGLLTSAPACGLALRS